MADYTADLRNLRSELDNAATKFNKELNEGMKKLGSLAKNADELGKKMQSVVDPAILMDKTLSQMAARYEALKNQSAGYAATMDKARNQLFNITAQLEEMQQLQQKENGDRNNLTRSEQERLSYLEKQRTSLEGSYEEYQRIYFEALNLKYTTDQQLKNLEKQKNTLEVISAVYSTIISLGEKYDALLSEQAKAQGTTKDEINRQYDTIQKITGELSSNFATNQEILKAVTAIRKEYALTDTQLATIGKESANISRLTGLSVDEATKFQTTLAEVGGTSVMAQEAMTVIAAKAAEAAGVPMGQVMKDVANASSAVRTIFKGNTTELIKQAAEARKLGTSLDAAAKSAEALLNFESSIGAELKAAALLGQNLSFNESRRLAFAGDLIGAEKALQKEIERVGDLDKLNYNQRKALAEATGKDFSELQKIQTQKKNLLEAERLFPEEAKKMKKAQEELRSLEKKGADARKAELELMLRQKTAEAESQKLAQAKEQALLNLGKLLQPVYAIIMSVQTAFFNAIAAILSFKASWSQVLIAITVGVGTVLVAFYTLKFGLTKVLEFLGNMFGKAAQVAGEGLGKGLEGISRGITSLGTAVGGLKWSDMAKLAVLLVLITGAAMGLGYAMSMLGQTSATQILAFTAALVILGAGLAIIAGLMTPPSPLGAGLLIFAGALAVTSLAAIGFAKAIQMVTPSLGIIGGVILGLGNIVAGVITTAFKTMLDVFKQLPAVVGGVAGPLVKLALVSPLLIVAAAGVGALSASLGILGAALILFPTRELTRVTTQLSLLAISASGIRAAVSSLKELSGIELPKIELGNVAALAAVSAVTSANKSNETKEIKQGLELVAQKIDTLTTMMANGGIAVNLDGRQVNYALAKSANTRGSLGQATF